MTAGLQAKGGIQNYIGMRREIPAWHKRLTSQFDNDTRLVGPIISCEGTPFEGNPNGEWRAAPHVQSHAIAVDQVLRCAMQPSQNLMPACQLTHAPLLLLPVSMHPS